MDCPDCFEKMRVIAEERELLPPSGFFYSPREGGPEEIRIKLKQTFNCFNGCFIDLVKTSYQTYEKNSNNVKNNE